MAHVVAVNTSVNKGEIKTAVPEVELIVNFGIKGDAHAGDWHRQVSFLGQESIRKIEEKGLPDLCSGSFAENITTEGILLYELPVGTRLKVGPCLMEVTQIGKECHKHCAIYQKVGDCVMPREGIFARVLSGGIIKAGDEITVEKAEA